MFYSSMPHSKREIANYYDNTSIWAILKICPNSKDYKKVYESRFLKYDEEALSTKKNPIYLEDKRSHFQLIII